MASHMASEKADPTSQNYSRSHWPRLQVPRMTSVVFAFNSLWNELSLSLSRCTGGLLFVALELPQGTVQFLITIFS